MLNASEYTAPHRQLRLRFSFSEMCCRQRRRRGCRRHSVPTRERILGAILHVNFGEHSRYVARYTGDAHIKMPDFKHGTNNQRQSGITCVRVCVYRTPYGTIEPNRMCVRSPLFTFVKQSSSSCSAFGILGEHGMRGATSPTESNSERVLCRAFLSRLAAMQNVLCATVDDCETLGLFVLINCRRRRRRRTLYNLFSLTHRFAFYSIEWRSGATRTTDFITHTHIAYEALACELRACIKCKLM